ncbi:MAG: twin-arginine translocation signal domain-containing protein [Planctomycetota bacterium]
MSNRPQNQETDSSVSRRGFIKTASAAVAAGAAVGSIAATEDAAVAAPKPLPAGGGISREQQAFDVRVQAAQLQLDASTGLPLQEANGDEERYADQAYYASFTKTLPHNKIGEVDSSAYEALIAAADSGDPADYDAVPLDKTAGRKLANPQGALRFTYVGLDGHATRMPAAPTIRSAEAAGEMAEVYWLAVTRNVPFAQYRLNPLIREAVVDLNRFSVTPGFNDRVISRTLFRGETVGDVLGPYVSQFLLKDIPYGPTTIIQKYIEPATFYMADDANWLNILRGGSPLEKAVFEEDFKYIYNNNVLAEYVHTDVLFQAYFNALLIGLSFPGAVDVTNPYANSTNQGGFTSGGGPWFIDMLTQVANLALNSAWYHKWNVHRRLRPEVMAGRIHHHLMGNAKYELNDEIFDSPVLDILLEQNGTYYLPMGFIEGSPTHPSYPAGHATVAGACCTILKAVFNEDYEIPDPVVASSDGSALLAYNGRPLKIGNEINKLASNVTLGRDAAGVHYRSDGVLGNVIGERQALGVLQEYSLALNEEFDGFQLTKFDGTEIMIQNGVITEI